MVAELMVTYNVTDPFRELYLDLKRCIWRKNNPLKQASLDFCSSKRKIYGTLTTFYYVTLTKENNL